MPIRREPQGYRCVQKLLAYCPAFWGSVLWLSLRACALYHLCWVRLVSAVLTSIHSRRKYCTCRDTNKSVSTGRPKTVGRSYNSNTMTSSSIAAIAQDFKTYNSVMAQNLILEILYCSYDANDGKAGIFQRGFRDFSRVLLPTSAFRLI